MFAALRNLTCTLFGHHPDDLQIAPIGFTVDGDFCHVRTLACRRCGISAQVYLAEAALPVWTREL